MGVADGSAIVGHNIRNFVFAEHLSIDLAQLEASLLIIDLHGLESSLDVVHNAEVLASLGEGDHIHRADGVSRITADLVVNFDIARLIPADFSHLLAGEGVLQSVAEKDGHRDALSQLVWAGGWACRVHTTKLVQAPLGGCEHALHMLLWTSSLHVDHGSSSG